MNQFGPIFVLFLKTQIQHSTYGLYISPMITITKSTYSTNAFCLKIVIVINAQRKLMLYEYLIVTIHLVLCKVQLIENLGTSGER